MQKRFAAAALRLLVLAVMPAVGSMPAAGGEADAALWKALAGGGHVALLRHALAPGTGDPEHFDLDDCATQRNLSAAGRDQARRIGQRFRDHGIRQAAVHSSQWCRCLETARLLALGPVAPLPALNSFFRDRRREPAQTAQLRAFIRASAGPLPLVLVGHQVNITALTGLFPASGEIIVLRPEGDGLTVLGRIGAPSTDAVPRTPEEKP